MISSNDLSQFYEGVVRQFVEKLNKRYETRDGLDSNLIDRLHSKLKDKMKSQHLLFHRVTKHNHYEATIPADTTINVDLEVQQIKSENGNSSEDDFEAEMRKFDVKKEENDDEESKHDEKKEEPPKQEYDPQLDDSAEDHIKQQRMIKAQSNIMMHIVGTYSTKQKKHIAKDERTKIDLDNVFIKVNSHGYGFSNEICFQKLSCDFSKTEGEKIQL